MHLAAAAAVLAALAALLRLPIGRRPKAAIPHLAHRILERQAAVAVAEVAVGACSGVPLAGGQSRDPMESVEARLLETAGAVLGDTVRQVLQAAEAAHHGPCCGRDYSSVRQEAAARQLLVLRPEVRLLLHEGHPLALPYQSWVW